jgi:hypothetical protein
MLAVRGFVKYNTCVASPNQKEVKMQILPDSNGNKYFRFNNVRVSVKHADPGKDWDGTRRYLQILAYRDATSTTTFPGPQIPITSKHTDEEILAMFWAGLNSATI